MRNQQARKWFKVAVLGASAVVFLGLSIMPIVSGLMQNQQTGAQRSPNPANPGGPNDAKQLQETEKNYLAVLEREANNQPALQGLVETRMQLIQAGQRKPEDVIEPLQKLAKLQPEQAQYQLILAQAQQQAGKVDAAFQGYQQILAKSPASPEALQGITQLLVRQKRSSEAIPILEQGLAAAQEVNKKQPGAVDTMGVNLLLGDVYRTQKDVPAASALFEKLIKEAPMDFRPVAVKGLLLNDQGKKDEALKQFQTALSLASEADKPKVQALIDTLKKPPAPAPSASPSK